MQLKIKGAGFAFNAQVRFNGANLTPTSVTNSDISVVVPTEDVNAAGTAKITVVNPNTPPEVGTSNVAFFPIVNATASVATTRTDRAIEGGSPMSLAIGDLNTDGKLDFVVANLCVSDSNCSNGTVSVLLGDGTGQFTTVSAPATAGYNARSLALGDFNGDRKLDLAVVNCCASASNCSMAMSRCYWVTARASSPPLLRRVLEVSIREESL